MSQMFSKEALMEKYINAEKIITLLEHDANMTWNEFLDEYSGVLTSKLIYECFQRADWEHGESDLYISTIGDARKTRFAKTIAGVRGSYDDEDGPEPDALSFVIKGSIKKGLLTRTALKTITIVDVFTNMESCYLVYKAGDSVEVIDVLAKRESKRQIDLFDSALFYLVRDKKETFEEMVKSENLIDKVELDLDLINDGYSFNYSY